MNTTKSLLSRINDQTKDIGEKMDLKVLDVFSAIQELKERGEIEELKYVYDLERMSSVISEKDNALYSAEVTNLDLQEQIETIKSSTTEKISELESSVILLNHEVSKRVLRQPVQLAFDFPEAENLSIYPGQCEIDFTVSEERLVQEKRSPEKKGKVPYESVIDPEKVQLHFTFCLENIISDKNK